jgi:hypothetical protein
MKHLLLVGLIFLLGACVSVPVPEEPKALSEYDAPEWVLIGGGAFTDDRGKAFYGVGSATGIKNFSLQRQVADDRARADLAKVFEVYTETLTKDYQAHTTAGSFATSTEEQNSEAAIKVVVSSTLRGVMIVDHFEIPERQEFISLARLDYDAFKRNVEQAEEFKVLPPQVRQDIKDRADKLHEEMEAEAKKLAENRGFFAEDM